MRSRDWDDPKVRYEYVKAWRAAKKLGVSVRVFMPVVEKHAAENRRKAQRAWWLRKRAAEKAAEKRRRHAEYRRFIRHFDKMLEQIR